MYTAAAVAAAAGLGIYAHHLDVSSVSFKRGSAVCLRSGTCHPFYSSALLLHVEPEMHRNMRWVHENKHKPPRVLSCLPVQLASYLNVFLIQAGGEEENGVDWGYTVPRGRSRYRQAAAAVAAAVATGTC